MAAGSSNDVQRISAWEIPAAGGGAGAALPVFAGVVFSRKGSQLKVTGDGLVPESVAAISAEVLRVFSDAVPVGLSLRGESALRPRAFWGPRAARGGGGRGAGAGVRTKLTGSSHVPSCSPHAVATHYTLTATGAPVTSASARANPTLVTKHEEGGAAIKGASALRHAPSGGPRGARGGGGRGAGTGVRTETNPLLPVPT